MKSEPCPCFQEQHSIFIGLSVCFRSFSVRPPLQIYLIVMFSARSIIILFLVSAVCPVALFT